MEGPWHVYLVECSDGSLYCGVTNDLARRVAMHNAGKGARYTSGRRPVQLVWCEPQPTRGEALRREVAIKRLRVQAKRRVAGLDA